MAGDGRFRGRCTYGSSHLTADSHRIGGALSIAPVRPFRATLARCVALSSLAAKGVPDYLFTSGQAGRLNPAGVSCVYFSEDERTARAEYARRLGASTGSLQPLGIYFARVRLGKVIDLADQQTRERLGLTNKDLWLPWQRAKSPTNAQLLGLAVSKQATISAIRFASDAAHVAGFVGFNVAIFRNCVRPPDIVRILGATRKSLQRWP
jgi:RES domain-containing protein